MNKVVVVVVKLQVHLKIMIIIKKNKLFAQFY